MPLAPPPCASDIDGRSADLNVCFFHSLDSVNVNEVICFAKKKQNKTKTTLIYAHHSQTEYINIYIYVYRYIQIQIQKRCLDFSPLNEISSCYNQIIPKYLIITKNIRTLQPCPDELSGNFENLSNRASKFPERSIFVWPCESFALTPADPIRSDPIRPAPVP